MPLYHLITYGCQMNYADSERVASVLESLGYEETKNAAETDFLLYNTCSVRQKAEDRILGLRPLWQQMKKKNPKLIIALTGCMPAHGQYDLQEMLPELDIVFNIENLEELPAMIRDHGVVGTGRGPFLRRASNDYFSISPKSKNPFQVFIPIMTGCDNFCSYCIVPYARGREKSRPFENILEEAKQLLADGAKEITLLGQNVNSYHPPEGGAVSFPKLLELVNDLPGLERLRFVSSHPKDLSDELIECFATLEKLCPHLHLPAQAGSNEILKAMNRNYTREDYLKLIQKLRKACPEIKLTTDIIVGFPGETKQQFKDTLELVSEVGFEMIYIAKYSPRPGTLAYKLKDDVPFKEKKRRFRVLEKALGDYLKKANQNYLGKTVEVLVEGLSEKKEAYGRTPGFKQVTFPKNGAKPGDLVKVKVTEALKWELRGDMISND